MVNSSSSSGGGSSISSSRSSSSKSLLCCGVDAVMLPALYPINVVGLDAAAAAHPHNVEWESNCVTVAV